MLRIMIAVDGSPLALDAVHHALDLVRRGGLQATLVLGHVQEEASLLELATQGADAVAQAFERAGCTVVQVPDVIAATGRWAHHIAPDLIAGARMAGLF